MTVLLTSGATTFASETGSMAAGRLGEVLGAAGMCGVPPERVTELAERGFRLIAARARAGTAVRSAQAAFESGVAHGAQRVALGRQSCHSAMHAFRSIEGRG